MKIIYSVAALCLVFACSSLTEASRLERTLLQEEPTEPSSTPTPRVEIREGCIFVNDECRARATVSSQTINDAASSIANALAAAIATVENGGDVEAAATVFATVIARAYARIISVLYRSVFVNGERVDACVFVRITSTVTIRAIVIAISQAFAGSSNQVAIGAAGCFSEIVSLCLITIVQRVTTITWFGGDGGVLFFFRIIETTAFIRKITVAFINVLIAIRDINPIAEATCAAAASNSALGSTPVTTSG